MLKNLTESGLQILAKKYAITLIDEFGIEGAVQKAKEFNSLTEAGEEDMSSEMKTYWEYISKEIQKRK